MDAILPAFLAALLGQWGERTQLLATRFERGPPVFAGIAVAALTNSLISAFAGSAAAELVTFSAVTLMLALALLFAGLASLRPKPAAQAGAAGGKAFLSSAAGFLVAGFGDKTQFLTFAISAHSGSPALAAAGAAAGIVAGAAPAILLGRSFERIMPVRGIRIAAAILFLLGGGIAALIALRLV